jgi:hypothetical protein
MQTTGRIVGINLLIFIGYTLIMHLVHKSVEDAAFIGAFIAYGHAGGLLLTGAIIVVANKGENRSIGGALILSGLLLYIIGFSTCLGTVAMDNNGLSNF